MESPAKPVDLLSGSELRRQVRATARQRALELTDQLIHRFAPELAAETPGAGLSSEQTAEIVNALEEGVSTAQLRSCRKYLRAQLRQLAAKTGGEVVEPPREVYVRRDESPFAGDAMRLVSDLNILVEQFLIDVQTDLSSSVSTDSRSGQHEATDTEDAEEAKRRCRHTLGRILFSAVVNGGLINQSLLRQLLPALCDSLQGRDECAWVSFPLDPLDEEDDDDAAEDEDENVLEIENLDLPVRRWFLDPLTLGLVTRWKASRSLADCRLDLEKTSALTALRSYLSHLRKQALKSSGTKAGKSWSARILIRAARARLSLHLPQVLIRFLSSTSGGQSMSERSWWRYKYGHRIPTKVRAPLDPDLTAELAAQTQQIKHSFQGKASAFYKLQEELLALLQQCLRPPGYSKKKVPNNVAITAIEGALKARKGDMSPLLYTYYRWILWKLSRPSRAVGRIRTVSAERYTSRLGRALIALGTELQIDGLNASDWEEFYDDVIESLESDADRRKAYGNLRDFHGFLMITVNAPRVAIDGQVDGSSRGRATIITDADFRHVLKVLDRPSGQAHRARMLHLIVILMYRVGLRPHEIVDLEYGHFHGCSRQSLRKGTAQPVLYLKARSQETLKTRSAVRQIPLGWFLQDDELAELQSYLYDRLSAYRDRDLEKAIIFTPELGSNNKIPEKKTFGLITELLRQVTGDTNVVAYSLRHSCLSNLFLNLFKPDSRNEGLPREASYALSTFAGHLDPDISLQTYIHLQDYAAYLHLRSLFAEQTSISLWAALEGKPAQTLLQRRYMQSRRNAGRFDEQERPQWLDTSRRLVTELSLEAPKGNRRHKATLPEQLIEANSLLDLDIITLHALFVSMHRAHSKEARVRLFDLPEWQIKSLIDTSKRLGGYKSKPVQGNARSRTLGNKPKRRGIPELYRKPQPGVLAPAPPNYWREEMEEADRIHKLIIKRAKELRLDRQQVSEEIIKPIRDLFFAHSRSESVVRITNAEQFARSIATLRSLNIRPERIEIEIESLPSLDLPDAASWMRQLRRLGKSRKLGMSEGNSAVTRRSRKYPEFGIVLLRVLELSKPDVGELARKARGRAGDRAGSGWRVGCYYALVVLTAFLYRDDRTRKAKIKKRK